MMIKEHVISKRLATRMCIPTEDLVNWTPMTSGTWTDPGDGGVEVDLPLAGDKRFYRVVVEFE